ncbi:hypothetical protein, partial [Huaxiibacter chinensis]
MKKSLWVLNPVLLAFSLPLYAEQSDEENVVVSATRSHRTVAEMAQ